MNADFIMIVANLCGIKLEECVVPKDSDLEKVILKRACQSTFPILEID